MKTLALLVLMAGVLVVTACSDDPSRPSNGASGPTFQPLTSRNAVVNNLEVAWNLQRIDKIDELLDSEFDFYIKPSAVGGEVPPSWDRADEIAVTMALFESNQVQNPIGPVCVSVNVNLIYDELIWTEVPVPASGVEEVWYATTIECDFTFEMEPDLTFLGYDDAIQLTVRQVGNEWRLVEWRELGTTLTSRFTDPSCESCEGSWGGVKALYR